MSELRWTLLILGVVFIAALSWWERRRPRQAFAPRLRAMGGSHSDAQRTASPEPPIGVEPWIGESGLSEVVSSDLTLTDAADEPHAEASMHARLDSAPGPLEDLPMLVIPDAEECRALEAAWTAQPPEPRLIDPQTPDAAAAALTASTAMEPRAADAPMSANEPLAAVAANEPAGAIEPIAAQDSGASAVPPATPPHRPAAPAQREIPGAEGVGAVRIVESAYGNGAAPVEPIVEWPPEESRRIIALRLVAPQTARFAGRTLRLALAAEGFLLGKFSIFHKPDETNRAVLSAASLTRPGAFDLETMDSQRYAGLSLFAVLPGVKAPAQAFEELLATARNLNERLEGALQDERGGPLTPLRVASIRETLRAEAATLPAAAAAHGA
jgi:FtsZ-interacting cell division protein ZipA